MIYLDGKSVKAQGVKALLEPTSTLPVQVCRPQFYGSYMVSLIRLLQAAFSIRLLQFGVNFFSLFAPDFLHEFELGGWKRILEHLIRILQAIGGDSLMVFNERFVAALLSLPHNPHQTTYTCIVVHKQVSSSTYLWSRHYTTLWERRIRSKEDGGPRLRRYTAGRQFES